MVSITVWDGEGRTWINLLPTMTGNHVTVELALSHRVLLNHVGTRGPSVQSVTL